MSPLGWHHNYRLFCPTLAVLEQYCFIYFRSNYIYWKYLWVSGRFGQQILEDVPVGEGVSITFTYHFRPEENQSKTQKSERNYSLSTIIVSVFVIFVLLAAGPADAVIPIIKDLPNHVFRGDQVNFALNVEIGPIERVPIQIISLLITKAETSSTLACSFYPNGTMTPESSAKFKCGSLAIKNTNMINETFGDRLGYDNYTGFFQDFGYGYGFDSGPSKLSYNVTWNTLKFGGYNLHGVEGNYTIKMLVKADNTYTYNSQTKNIRIIKVPGGKDICNPEDSPNTCTGRFTVTRELPETCNVDEEIEVKVNIDVNEANRPKLLVLREHIPEGFVLTAQNGGSYDSKTRILQRFYTESKYYNTKIEDTTFTYKIKPIADVNEVIFGTVEDTKEIVMTKGDQALDCGFNPVQLQDIDGDEFPAYLDCDDNDENIWPGAVEMCNGVDDDCDVAVDESFPNLESVCGTGACAGVYVCSNDGSATVCNGAAPVTEVCGDGIDNDCDWAVDEGCVTEEEPVTGPFTVTRDLPDNVGDGEQFYVNLSVDIDESDRPDYYVLREFVPVGLDVTNKGGAYYDSAKRMLKWQVVESAKIGTHVADTEYKYKAKAAQGIFVFKGNVTTDGLVTFDTGGDKTLEVD